MTVAQLTGVARAHRAARRYLDPWLSALVAGGLLCLGGRRDLGILLFGAVLWSCLSRAAAEDARDRAAARALALVTLTGLLPVAVPLFLGPGADSLMVLGLGAVPLAWSWTVSPDVRRVLRLRRRARPDRLLLAYGAAAGVLAGAVVALARGWVVATPSIPTFLLVALLMPVLDEAVYRGLLMDALGTSWGVVLGVALVEAALTGAAYGWWAFLLAGLLGLLLSFVRRVTGHWQAPLALHLGVSLGVLLAYFLSAGLVA